VKQLFGVIKNVHLGITEKPSRAVQTGRRTDKRTTFCGMTALCLTSRGKNPSANFTKGGARKWIDLVEILLRMSDKRTIFSYIEIAMAIG